MSAYNDEVVTNAKKSVEKAIQTLLSLRAGGAVIGVAPAGAGKSHAIGSAVLAARKANLRLAVATPTNEQAFALASSIADRIGRARLTFLHSAAVHLPDHLVRANITSTHDAKSVNGADIIVGTLAKLGDAYSRGSLAKVDALLIDEAYQANSVQYYMIADLAPRHLLMGDSGQLAPFSTAPDGDRWRGLDEDPLLTAVEVLQRNHPATEVIKLPITRRLDPRGAAVAQSFYPNHPFRAAVKDGVRKLTLSKTGAAGGRGGALDRALETASAKGWAHVELPESAVVSADPETIELLVDFVSRLLARSPKVQCEENPTPSALQQAQIAIAVSHNDQKDLLRAALQRRKLNGVHVDTANKLQGLTFEVVLAWHPLAGLGDVDEFHLDPGRLCVMLTRHRQACIVVGRAGDRRLVEGIPPATPSYVGWESNPALDGWYAHEAVFSALEPYRMAAP
jgi:hypothetical protein